MKRISRFFCVLSQDSCREPSSHPKDYFDLERVTKVKCKDMFSYCQYISSGCSKSCFKLLICRAELHKIAGNQIFTHNCQRFSCDLEQPPISQFYPICSSLFHNAEQHTKRIRSFYLGGCMKAVQPPFLYKLVFISTYQTCVAFLIFDAPKVKDTFLMPFFIAKNRQVQFIPDPNYFGPDELLLMVTDGQYVPWFDSVGLVLLGRDPGILRQLFVWQKAFNQHHQQENMCDICEPTLSWRETWVTYISYIKSFECTLLLFAAWIHDFFDYPFCEARLRNFAVVTHPNPNLQFISFPIVIGTGSIPKYIT